MREWIIENTNITATKYDETITNNIGIKSSEVSKDYRCMLLCIILCFTLEEPTKEHLARFGITCKNTTFYFQGLEFHLFSEILDDPKLFSLERYGECHFNASMLARVLHATVVTAVCKDQRNNRFLHSYLVETNIRGEEIVLHYSLNLIMKKDLYYALLEAEEIKRVPEEELIELSTIVERNLDICAIDYREMLCFPSEIKEGILKLERNKK